MIDLPVDVDAIKARLMARRDELAKLIETSATSRDVVELDQTRVGRLSRMDALQHQEMALETKRRRQQELSRISIALERLASGDYGYCIDCDEAISAKRLALDASILICIRCAEKSSTSA